MKVLLIILCFLFSHNACAQIIIEDGRYPDQKDFKKHMYINRDIVTFQDGYNYTYILNRVRTKDDIIDRTNTYTKTERDPLGKFYNYEFNPRYYYLMGYRFYKYRFTSISSVSSCGFKLSKLPEDTYEIFEDFLSEKDHKYEAIIIFDEAFSSINGCIVLKQQQKDYSQHLDRIDILIKYIDLLSKQYDEYYNSFYVDYGVKYNYNHSLHKICKVLKQHRRRL